MDDHDKEMWNLVEEEEKEDDDKYEENYDN